VIFAVVAVLAIAVLAHQGDGCEPSPWFVIQQPVKPGSFLALLARNDRRFLIKRGEVTLGPSHGRVRWPFHHRSCEGPSVIPLLSYTAPVIPSPQGEETPLPCAYRYDGCEPSYRLPDGPCHSEPTGRRNFFAVRLPIRWLAAIVSVAGWNLNPSTPPLLNSSTPSKPPFPKIHHILYRGTRIFFLRPMARVLINFEERPADAAVKLIREFG